MKFVRRKKLFTNLADPCYEILLKFHIKKICLIQSDRRRKAFTNLGDPFHGKEGRKRFFFNFCGFESWGGIKS